MRNWTHQARKWTRCRAPIPKAGPKAGRLPKAGTRPSLELLAPCRAGADRPGGGPGLPGAGYGGGSPGYGGGSDREQAAGYVERGRERGAGAEGPEARAGSGATGRTGAGAGNEASRDGRGAGGRLYDRQVIASPPPQTGSPAAAGGGPGMEFSGFC